MDGRKELQGAAEENLVEDETREVPDHQVSSSRAGEIPAEDLNPSMGTSAPAAERNSREADEPSVEHLIRAVQETNLTSEKIADDLLLFAVFLLRTYTLFILCSVYTLHRIAFPASPVNSASQVSQFPSSPKHMPSRTEGKVSGRQRNKRSSQSTRKQNHCVKTSMKPSIPSTVLNRSTTSSVQFYSAQGHLNVEDEDLRQNSQQATAIAKNKSKAETSDVNDELLNDGDDVENVVAMQETTSSEESGHQSTHVDHSFENRRQRIHPSVISITDSEKPVCYDDEGLNFELSSVYLDSLQLGTHVLSSRIQNQHEVQASADRNTRQSASAKHNTEQICNSSRDMRQPSDSDRLLQSRVGPDTVNHLQHIFPPTGITDSGKPLSHHDDGCFLRRSIQFDSQMPSLRISNPVACSDQNSSDYASAELDTGQASASSRDTGDTYGISEISKRQRNREKKSLPTPASATATAAASLGSEASAGPSEAHRMTSEYALKDSPDEEPLSTQACHCLVGLNHCHCIHPPVISLTDSENPVCHDEEGWNSQLEEIQQWILCNICWSNRWRFVFRPCGHGTCKSCYRKICNNRVILCPFCRQPIADFIIAKLHFE